MSLLCALWLCSISIVWAQDSSKAIGHDVLHNRSQIMILGVYHFSSSADLIKLDLDDILGEQRQKEIAELNASLLTFRPDKIFVEWPPETQPRVDSLYQAYRDGDFALGANEVYQIGFRMAAALNLPGVYCMDASGWYLYDTLVATARTSGQYEAFSQAMENLFAEVMARDSLNRTLSIREKLLLMNAPQEIMRSHLLNAGVTTAASLGTPGEYGGAEFIGEWYKRNIRMYSNIVRQLSDADDRILVIVGAGHARILMHFFQDHPDFELIAATNFLMK